MGNLVVSIPKASGDGKYYGRYPDGNGPPETYPLIAGSANLKYIGYFYLPSAFAYGGDALAMGPIPGTLYASGNPLASGNGIGCVNIPSDANLNGSIATMYSGVNGGAFQGTIQDYIYNNSTQKQSTQPLLRGAKLVSGTLYISYVWYYPGNRGQTLNYVSIDQNLDQASLKIDMQIGTANDAATYAVWGPIASEWQSLLGGDTIATNGIEANDAALSWGPCASFFSSSGLGSLSAVPATTGVFFPYNGGAGPGVAGMAMTENNTAGEAFANIQPPNAYYSQADAILATFVPSGYRSLVFLMNHAAGLPCYGVPTATYSQNFTLQQSSGDAYFYNATGTGGKGQVIYPVIFNIVAYDLLDVLAVLAGTKQPNTLVPHVAQEISLPSSLVTEGQFGNFPIGNGAGCFDPATGRIYAMVGLTSGGGTPTIAVFQWGDADPAQLHCSDGSILPAASVGSAYNHVLGISGGTPPYTVTVQSQLNMASNTGGTWLSVSSGGVISGTPDTQEWDLLILAIADSAGNSISRSYMLEAS